MQIQNNKLSFKGQNIYAGIDAHLKSWTVTIQVEDRVHKTFSQSPEPKVLVDYLRRHFPEGNYFSAYEASFCGFRAHYELNEMGKFLLRLVLFFIF